MVARRNCRYWGIAVLIWTGCQGQPPAPAKPPSLPAAESGTSVALRVLVVNDVPLAEAIGRLRGEWREVSGGELTAASKPWSEVIAAHPLDADLIIFPTRYMGELCTRGWLRPVRKSVLEDESLEFADFFPLVRRQLITWGGAVMALPLCIDLPGVDPTRSSVNYLNFLERAAPHIASRDRVGALFDPDTMKPRITEPAFVEAMKDFEERPSDGRIFDRVPLLGVGDRLAAVTTSTKNAASAFQLLSWLAGADVSSQLAPTSSGMPVRRSLLSSSKWYRIKLDAREQGELGDALEGELFLMIPRIPGADEYLAALDEAVHATGRAETTKAAERLQQAAEKWEKITDAHGRKAQREACLKDLGIGEP
ncbi:MAG TPA: hypothetical protein VGM76_17560 [Lacipirellulaceae bacterium]|jgi:hypothetical protein